MVIRTIGEYSGCLYERPTADDGVRDWRVDASSGVQYAFDLTKSEIKNMRMKGIPIKIEHTHGEAFSKDDEVGEVLETTTIDPDTPRGTSLFYFILFYS